MNGIHRARPIPRLGLVGAAALAVLIGAVIITWTLRRQDDQTRAAVAVAISAAAKVDDIAAPVLEQCVQGGLRDARTADGRPLCQAAAEAKRDPVVRNPAAAIGTTAPTVTVTAAAPPPVVVSVAPSPAPTVTTTATATTTETAPAPPRATVTETQTTTPPPSTVTRTETPPATTTTDQTSPGPVPTETPFLPPLSGG
jgi:hypothetical protein